MCQQMLASAPKASVVAPNQYYAARESAQLGQMLLPSLYIFRFKRQIPVSTRRADIGEHNTSREIRRLHHVRDVTFSFTGNATGRLAWLRALPLRGVNALQPDRLRCTVPTSRRSWIGVGEKKILVRPSSTWLARTLLAAVPTQSGAVYLRSLT